MMMTIVLIGALLTVALMGGIGWWKGSHHSKGSLESIVEEVIDEQQGVEISITPKKGED